MKKLIFMALFISLVNACCFGPGYRAVTPTTTVATKSIEVVVTADVFIVEQMSGSGKVPSKNLEPIAFNLAAVRIDMPATVNRGDNLYIGVYPPTSANIEEIVAVVGIANYLNLNKQPDTSFTGYFRVPEVFDPGQYTTSFFIRTKDNKRRVLQRLLTVQ
jgi:hypothetical protein